MKLFALASALAGIIICPPADARSLQTQESHVLRHVMIDGQPTKHVGVLTINHAASTIKVDIMNDICGHYAKREPGTFTCLAMPVKVTTLEVPLEKREKSCGSLVLSGSEDNRIRDGFGTEITVMNHSGRICEDVRPFLIEVRATRFNPWTQTATHFYLGGN